MAQSFAVTTHTGRTEYGSVPHIASYIVIGLAVFDELGTICGDVMYSCRLAASTYNSREQGSNKCLQWLDIHR